jgi:hypothetical protein
MGLTTVRTMALGCHAFFWREGDAFTIPEEGTAGVNSKPGAEDPLWPDKGVGVIESFEDAIADEDEKKVYQPAPGHLVIKDVIMVKQGMTLKFTTNEVSPLALEAFYRTSQKLDLDSAQFNPLSEVPRKGWLKIQRYDHEDTLVVVLDAWVRLKVIGGMKGGDGNLVLPEFEAYMLYSQYNTAAI